MPLGGIALRNPNGGLKSVKPSVSAAHPLLEHPGVTEGFESCQVLKQSLLKCPRSNFILPLKDDVLIHVYEPSKGCVA